MTNPCTYKNVCKSCKKVQLSKRPQICEVLSCPEYTPCVKCGVNKTLDEKGRCAKCNHSSIAGDDLIPLELPDGSEKSIDTSDGGGFEITPPGIPPARFNEHEKNYYMAQWKAYSDFYRDPSSYPICHNIIITEIELETTNSMLSQLRRTDNAKLLSKRKSLVDSLASLKKLLPDREALLLSEDEKALSRIYEKFLEENGRMNSGRVTRYFTDEAIALASYLHFPVDVDHILRTLGYSQIDKEQMLEQYLIDEGIPNTDQASYPEVVKLLEHFGFLVEERLAGDGNPEENQPERIKRLIEEEEELELEQERQAKKDRVLSGMPKKQPKRKTSKIQEEQSDNHVEFEHEEKGSASFDSEEEDDDDSFYFTGD